ncbi:MAG: hypothetical protein FJZ59_00785 [Chlamydiae bacterium]|jgi:DNA polymerase V|nr:hypothetical protein [Chlamydiota bacterium]
MLLDHDQVDKELNLNEFLIKHPAATFLFRVSGKEVIEERISPGDILIVDRSLPVTKGKIVVATLDGELVVKRVTTEREELLVFGVVTTIIHSV